MTGKQFGLEHVLKYRLEIERVRKQEFVAAKEQHEEANEHLKQEENLVHDLSDEFCKRHSEMDSIEELQRYADFFARKREDIKQQRERVNHLGAILSDRRDDLLDATKDKKILESLKEKKQQEFKNAMAHKEQLFMDEISIQKKAGT